MQNKKEIINQQKSFIEEMKLAAAKFVKSFDKTEIETVLLAGSVARGDYFPGKMGGMIDLIAMKKDGSLATAEEIWGPNQDPEIPFHCIKWENIWFSILFCDFISAENFTALEEARKFSVLESEIIYDANGKYKNQLDEINKIRAEECRRELNGKIGYIHYLLSDYKKDRWLRRGAFIQLHENLNTAIRMGICCLFYKNNSYVPAEDRQLYYSLTLPVLPANFESRIMELKNQNTESEEDYKRREQLFRALILEFLE